MLWSFSYNFFVKFNSKRNIFGRHYMTILYPNRCYNEVFYKGVALSLLVQYAILYTNLTEGPLTMVMGITVYHCL